jgi:hypothetical protein
MWINLTVCKIYIAKNVCFAKHISNDMANSMTPSSSLVVWLEAEMYDRYLNSRLCAIDRETWGTHRQTRILSDDSNVTWKRDINVKFMRVKSQSLADHDTRLTMQCRNVLHGRRVSCLVRLLLCIYWAIYWAIYCACTNTHLLYSDIQLQCPGNSIMALKLFTIYLDICPEKSISHVPCMRHSIRLPRR